LIDTAPGVRTTVSSVAPAAAVAILGSVVYGDAEAEIVQYQGAVASA
jgi:spore germination cell wall hydrolase CwlJ-like protein